jgi:cell division protein FtsB
MKPLDNHASDDNQHLSTDDNKLIKLDTPAFTTWLGSNKSFRFEAGTNGCDSYRARKETLSGVDYWYAVKKVAGKLHKRFIGKSEEVTHNRLIEISKLIRQPPQKQKPATDSLEPDAATDNVNERLESLENLVKCLQSQVEELSKKLNNSDDPVVSSELEKENQQSKAENQQLTKQVGRLTSQNKNLIVNQVSEPDYIAIRNRVVNEWKVAKRAETKERIALAIDKFIQAVTEMESDK